MRLAKLLLIATAATLVSAGCSHGAAEKSTPTQVLTSLPPGMSQAFQIADFGAYDSIGQAEAGWEDDCVRRAGFTPPRRTADGSLAKSVLISRETFGPLSEAEARRQGLHTGPVTDGESVPAKESAAMSEAESKCVEEARKLLGTEVVATQQAALQLQGDLMSEYRAQMNPRVDEGSIEIRSCAQKAGWVAAHPSDLANLDINPAEVFGVQTGTTTDDATTGGGRYTPTPKEIDLALAFLKCRLDLGLPDQQLAEAKRIQALVVAKNEQRIRELNTRLKESAHKAPELLK